MKRFHNPHRLVFLGVALLAAIVVVPAASAAGPPANDHFVNGQGIAGTEGQIRGFTLDGTKEVGEPNHVGDPGGHSVWYRWTAPQTGRVRFVTGGSDFDTLLAVYTGDTVATLTPIAANDDAGGTQLSEVTFNVVGGAVYHVAVDGSGGESGSVLLSWFSVPPNDDFEAAQAVSGPFGQTGGTNMNAGVEPDEPNHARVGGFSSVWYRWTAPANGRFKFDTLGSDFDTVLAVYTGDELASLVHLGANDDSPVRCCLESRVAFAATEGAVYQIAVDGFFGEMGSIVLNWSPVLIGTPAVDRLVGTSGPEEILGLGGNDAILAGGGDDLILGGAGNDTIRAGEGDDFASGNVGTDLVDGGAGDDILFDLWGIDRLLGGAGNDWLSVQDGRRNDWLRGADGRDRCFSDRGDVRRGCP